MPKPARVEAAKFLSDHCSIFRAWSLKSHGGIAQLGERLPCKQEVTSSILVVSTSSPKEPPGTEAGVEMYLENCIRKKD